jgi:hypothetical protein
MRYTSFYSMIGGQCVLRRVVVFTLSAMFAFSVGAPLAAHNSLLATHFLSKVSSDAGAPPATEGPAISEGIGRSGGPEATWRLRMHFAQATLDSAVATLHGVDRLRALPRTELEKILVRYVRDSVRITGDAGGTIRLAHAVPSVGGHESVFEFDVIGIPAGTEMLRVRIAAGAENRNFTNMLYTIIDGRKRRYVLDASNDYTVRARIAGRSIYVWALVTVACMILSAAVAGIFWKRRARTVPA